MADLTKAQIIDRDEPMLVAHPLRKWLRHDDYCPARRMKMDMTAVDGPCICGLTEALATSETDQPVVTAEAWSFPVIAELAEVLPKGWALTMTYHPFPENRWIASAWNFNGAVGSIRAHGFGRTDGEAILALIDVLRGKADQA